MSDSISIDNAERIWVAPNICIGHLAPRDRTHPRIDLLVRQGNDIQIIVGVSHSTPTCPATPESATPLARITIPPFGKGPATVHQVPQRTLRDFLLARIAEDEKAAREAPGGRFISWMALNPPRVLTECEAKRRIVALHTPDHECTDGSELYPGVFGADDDFEDCLTLHALAAIYADHPDYREEWRP